MIRGVLNGNSMTGLAALDWAQGRVAQGGVVVVKTTNYLAAAAPANNSLIGNTVVRFDDAMQASKPVFIELEFRHWYNGSYATYLARPVVRIGTGWDGANVTGRYATLDIGAFTQASGQSSFESSLPRHVAVATEPWALSLLWMQNASSSTRIALHIERARLADGTLNPNGRLVVALENTLNTFYEVEYGLPPLRLNLGYCAASTGRDLFTGRMFHFPPLLANAEGLQPPLLGLTFMGVNDTPGGVSVLEAYGRQRYHHAPFGSATNFAPNSSLLPAFYHAEVT